MKNLKKAYNEKLVSMLEEQESASEVNVEYRNYLIDPSKIMFAKMEKGNFSKYITKKKNKNKDTFDDMK